MDNRNLYCTVHFIYSEDGIPEWIKNIAEDQFMKARSRAVDLINSHFKEWNEAYEGKITDVDDGDMKYNAYIQEKENEILKAFNRKQIMNPVELFSDEYADICGRFKVFGKTITMEMCLEPINEKEWKEFHSQNA